MEGKVAVITGATSGIGWEAALLFAEKGLKVVLAGRNVKAGVELSKNIVQKGGDALFVQTDVAKEESVKNLIDSAKKHFGGIDYAFNNAGVEGKLKPLAELDTIDFEEVIDINLKGVWLCMKYQLLALIERGGGVIVNMSTSITRIGLPGTAIYTASKAGVEALSHVAAVEYGKYGIRINTVNPGAVDTPMLRRILNDELLSKEKEKNPLGKIATPKEVAETALWLLSPQASHVNGINIVLDGGHILLS
jgi:NAD(P)-dependent dehydrogenase (short-subunit alcohol dehydrogenase family)